LVDRSLQYRFVRVMLIMLLFMGGTALGSVYFALWSTLRTFELSGDPLTVALFTTVWVTVTLAMLFIAPFVVVMAVLITHRIAGPLVRIKAALEQMAHGDYNVRLTLRRGDSLMDLAKLINRLADVLRNKS